MLPPNPSNLEYEGNQHLLSMDFRYKGEVVLQKCFHRPLIVVEYYFLYPGFFPGDNWYRNLLESRVLGLYIREPDIGKDDSATKRKKKALSY